ncbi:MAG: GNAT family N-acetyltransferase [Proteobacteria bacterium]|nr:GNAT family N-acetyltransferase [Pseudomonadota bacterium]
MLERQNTKPEPIIKNDAFWFKPLFKECFGRDEAWLQHIDDQKYQAFHINKQAFIFTYTVQNSTDLLTIGVNPDQRKKGLGLSLMKWVINKAPQAQKFFLDVECQNIAAIQLYKKIGFEFISVRKGYYPQASGLALDAHVMTYQKPASLLL